MHDCNMENDRKVKALSINLHAEIVEMASNKSYLIWGLWQLF